ncbi:Copper chaperone [Handroanthus impetiginosus]|uniref:Copper chaperone n=1 Tax=Handroanthus impetiginosus TaxID=429701 RepID=A0A2G9G0L4_9LAMI|nr:Copper chaperone [Handroanthus impetiginosus]
MKKMDIFCASQAATAICLSMEQTSSSSPSSKALLSRGPAIDRHNPIIRDSRRISTTSHQLITPKPHKNHHKKQNPKIPFKENNKKLDEDKKKDSNNQTTSAVVRKSWSCTKPGDFISPHGSTRHLLSEKALFNALSDSDSGLKVFNGESSKKISESCCVKESSAFESSDQVVVLRVSLHCRGCERKMRKHISRMEGVTSFNIDFATKKVTLMGNITPLEVLSSISKVKSAQLWSPTMPSSPVN